MFPKGDRPHVRYLLDKQTHLAYRRLMKTLDSTMPFETSDVAQFRLHVLEYYYKWGLTPTLDAFGVKSSTLYDWKQAYETSGNKLISLVPRSTRPKTVRKMETDWRLVAFIKKMRTDHGNVGKYIIKPFVDAYAGRLGIASISPTTIGKIIKRRGFTFEKRSKARRKIKPGILRTRRSPKVKQPGYLEADTIELRLWGKKYYFICLIDIYTRYAYVELINRQNSIHTTQALIHFIQAYSYPVHTVQTDNGSEFFKDFDAYLKEVGIKHIFIYPNSPQLNGVVERFNRTIQEEFINRSDHLGVDNDRFKLKLQNYLSWYNTKRPHSSLGYQSPMQFMQS